MTASLWTLEDDSFPRMLSLWRRLEDPPPDILAVVEEWIPTRRINPFLSAKRSGPGDNFWFAEIPATMHGGMVVVCSYWVTESTMSVRCNMFGTLSWPV